jgi:hypothetical protein
MNPGGELIEKRTCTQCRKSKVSSLLCERSYLLMAGSRLMIWHNVMQCI